jgi:transaldolase
LLLLQSQPCGVDASQRIEQMATLFHTHQLPTRIMAASIKSSVEATKALLAHAHDLTVPPKVLLEMVSDPETEQAVERFEQDMKKLKAL